jgi:acetylornithine deacetylase
MRSLFKFVRQLIDIPSITGSEGDLARFLAKALAERGFEPELQNVAGDRVNVFASTGGPARVVFCTHLDTVPPFYESSEDERFIYGRGACDAKGILAAMVSSAVKLRDGGAGGLGLLFVVGEELDSIGAKAANQIGFESKYVLVGEPTQNRLASGHKGTFKFALRARGTAAHSAYPEQGDSAIDRLLLMLSQIRRADWGRSEILGEATVNIGKLFGGVAANVIAPEAEAHVYVRVVGRASEVESKLDRLLGNDSQMSYEIIAQNDAVFCEVLPDLPAEPVAFGTDIPSLTGLGKPLLLGPGSIHDAHTDHEKIGKDELIRAVELYCRTGRHLLEKSE